MDKKRVLMTNAAAIVVVVLLVLAVFALTKMLPQRQITPNAGVLGGFEPAVTAPAQGD